MIIYIDGIFDIFHYGHIESFRKCKELYPTANLIVGVISDHVATNYKRKPIYCEKHRYALVENSKYVDKIIKDPPLVITKKFMEQHNISKILHIFSNNRDGNNQEHFFLIQNRLAHLRNLNIVKKSAQLLLLIIFYSNYIMIKYKIEML